MPHAKVKKKMKKRQTNKGEKTKLEWKEYDEIRAMRVGELTV